MVINFKEGTAADTKTKNENTLAQLLVGKDAEYQKRVLAVTVQYGLKTSDPLFLVMLATGQLQVILEDKPKELSCLFDRWSGAIYERLETAKHSLEEQKRISLKGLEIEINKTARATAVANNAASSRDAPSGNWGGSPVRDGSTSMVARRLRVGQTAPLDVC